MQSLRAADGIGVYVHFPWCLKKCPYCDFLSVAVTGDEPNVPLSAEQARDRLPHERYADAVINELEARLAHLERPPPSLRSVFFGGGTPSLWDPSALGRVLRRVRELLGSTDKLETTVECNPTSFNRVHAAQLLAQGINRVSIGVQGLDNDRLAFLGRLHDEASGLRALQQAVEAKVPRVSADLIYGVYKQTPEAALSDIDRLIDTGISHLSAYTLTIEPGTRFGALAAQNKLPLLEEEQVAVSYEAVSERMRAHGFAHYEVSNFARPGDESVHNMGYWQGRDYLGLGTGAFGTVTTNQGRLRYKNLLSPDRYLDVWSDNPTSRPFHEHLSEREEITPEIAHAEALLLGLRTDIGVDLAEIAHLRGGAPWTQERQVSMEKLIATGRLERDNQRLSIPREHWLLADGIIRELI